MADIESAASLTANNSSIPVEYATPPPLVRSINSMRWWGAVLALEEYPEMEDCEASPRRWEWTWCLKRTDQKGIYLQNTYYNGNLMTSDIMDTNIENRDAFIAHWFPYYKNNN